MKLLFLLLINLIITNFVNCADVKLVPVITSVDPKILPSTATQITVKGMFFNSNPINGFTSALITIGSSNIDIKSSDNTTLTFYSPNFYQTPQTITITINGKKSNSFKFSYEKPIIESISIYDNDKLEIIGKNFGTTQSKNLLKIEIVNINEKEIISTMSSDSFLSINNTVILTTIPANSSSGKIRINFNNNSSLSNSLDITLTTTLTSLSNPNFSGGKLTVTGRYLSNEIYLIKNSVDGVSNTTNKLTCVDGTPTAATSTSSSVGDVSNEIIKICEFPERTMNDSIKFMVFSRFVDSKGNQTDSNYIEGNYERPIIELVQPNGFYYGDKLNFTFIGTNFMPNNGNLNIKIQGKSCETKLIESNKIICYFESDLIQYQNPIIYQVTVDTQSSDTTPLSDESTISFYSLCPGQQFINSTISNAPQQVTEGCSSQGVCNPILGECTCKPVYTGKDCSIEKYPSNSNVLSFSLSLILSSLLLLLSTLLLF